MSAHWQQVISFILVAVAQLTHTVDTDYWTRTATGCQCYFDSSRLDCACCQNGGCQCTARHPHQCVMCGVDSQCGTPMELDVWTVRRAGCTCYFDKSRNDCACCKNTGCACPAATRHQCVPCGYGCLCGQAAIVLDPAIFQTDTTPAVITTAAETTRTTAQINVQEEIITTTSGSDFEETTSYKVSKPITSSSEEQNICASSTLPVAVLILGILLGLAVCIIVMLVMRECFKTRSKSGTDSTKIDTFRSRSDNSRYVSPSCPPGETMNHYETLNVKYADEIVQKI